MNILHKKIDSTTKHASGNSGLMDYGELVGLREMKYRTLMNVLTHIPTSSIKPHAPDYLFLYRDETLAEEYEAGIAVDNIFSLSSSGVKTNRDGLTIAFNQTELDQRQAIFFGKGLSDADVAKALVIQNKKYWNVRDARKALSHQEWSDSCTTVEYRPFDQRRIVYHPALVFSTRKPVMVHLGCRENIALLFCRQQIVTGFSHVFATRNMFDCCLVSNRSRENTSGFPLYLVDSDDLFLVESARLKRNLTKQAIDIFQQAFGKIRDEEILYYIYAILHSPQYRKRYSEFLRRDFPRVPLTSNLVLHQSLAKLGNELVALHLLESTKVNDFITCFVGNGDNSISRKPTWENNTVWINSTQCFRGVPENVWNFYIGCYQVCEKWLKDRKGRTLSADDITHYQRIVVALSETIRLMGEIDGVIEQHGGWPDAFVQQKDIAIEPDRTAGVDIAVTSSELFPKDSEFVAPNPSHILKAAETEVEPLKTDRTDAHDAGQNKPDEPDIEEIILLIRQLFSDGNVRVRDDAINELAQNLGYQRTGHRIYEGLDNNLRTAVRRGIIENRDNGLAILARSIEDYDRDFLKDQFLASLQGVRWEERDEAVRDFARWMGFRRTGLAIDETARSLINGLIREGRLESEGQQIRKIR